jgi:hypothetical protein
MFFTRSYARLVRPGRGQVIAGSVHDRGVLAGERGLQDNGYTSWWLGGGRVSDVSNAVNTAVGL